MAGAQDDCCAFQPRAEKPSVCVLQAGEKMSISMRVVLGISLAIGQAVPLWAQAKMLPAARAAVAGRKALPAVAGKTLPAAAAGAAVSVQNILPAEAIGEDPAAVQNLFLNQPASLPVKNWKERVGSLWEKMTYASKRRQRSSVIADLTTLPPQVLEGRAEGLQRQVYESYKAVIELWKTRFAPEEEIPLLKAMFMPKLVPTETALKNNEWSLFFSRGIADKSDWLKQYPGKGKKELFRYEGADEKEYLARRLSSERMVFFGEVHHQDEIQDNLADLVASLRKQNPSRRIVLFTEFINLPPAEPGSRNTLATYYRRLPETPLAPITLADGNRVDYAPGFFWIALNCDIELYALEDPTQMQLFKQELGKQEFFSFYTLSQRNKTWARLMEQKMTEIRAQDPDALFLVYAGSGHTSWLMPFSLPKFFANEQPVVVDVTSERPSSHCLLYHVWGKEDPFFQRDHASARLYHWMGHNARLLGRQIGFDYAWTVPQK